MWDENDENAEVVETDEPSFFIDENENPFEDTIDQNDIENDNINKNNS